MKKSISFVAALGLAFMAGADVIPISNRLIQGRSLRFVFRGTGCSLLKASGFKAGEPLDVVVDGVPRRTVFPEVAPALKDGLHIVRITSTSQRKWKKGEVSIDGEVVWASREEIKDLFATRVPSGHPRLLVKADDDPLAALRDEKSLSPERRRLRRTLVKTATDALNVKPAAYKKTGRRLTIDPSVGRGSIICAAAYRITGERRFAERARDELLSVCAWPDWVPEHYLGTAQMLHLVAYTFDWIYDTLTESDRKRIFEAMKTKAFDTMTVGRNGYWRHCAMNWNQVCYEGVVAACVAFHEFMPEQSERFVAEAANHVQYAMEPYAPNGAYPEGPGYWGFGTGRCVQMLQLMDYCFGTTFSLDKLPGFLRTGDYVLAMYGASGKSFNYSDCGTHKRTSPNSTMAWLSVRAKRSDWARLEREAYLTGTPRLSYENALAFALLRGFPLAESDERLPLDYYSAGFTPVAMFRSSTAPDAATVGVKGGTVRANHAHMDIGSFIYDCEGVRWAEDLGSQNYHSLEKLGTIDLWNMGQDSTRWTVFRQMPQSHNLVTIDGERLKVAGFADLTPKGTGICEADLTSVYGTDLVTSATRRYALDRATRAFTVEDRIACVKPGAVLRWSLTTGADVAGIDGNVVHLTRDGHRLSVTALSPAAVDWLVEDISKGPNEWDCENKGMKQLVFTVPANDGVTNLGVRLAPEEAK